MRKKNKIFASFLLLLCVFLLTGCFRSSPQEYKADLEMWGVFDSGDAYGDTIREYRKINPFIGEIKYKKFQVDTYKKELLDALASGQGPDIFMINNAWLPQFKDKVEPAPEWITNEQEFRNNFPDVVVNDFFTDNKIYSTPLSVDSLALYYNKDLFNEAGFTTPPSTWSDVLAYNQQLKRIDSYGSITRAGISFGTAENINRSTDVLNVLMMQMGAEMNRKDGRPAFDDAVIFNNQKIIPGEAALDFYTQFADSANSLTYTWNPRMHYSIDSFYEGTSAMMVNYSWHIDTIKSKNAKINFAIAPLPQFSGGKTVNYANYWSFVVAKNKIITTRDGKPAEYDNGVRIHEAWEFLKYMTFKNNGKITLTNGKGLMQCLSEKKSDCMANNSKEFPLTIDPAREYLKETGKPAARRDIIEEQKSDPILSAFVYGNLIARSWYQKDSESVEQILANAIASINNGDSSIRDALSLAVSRITSLSR